MSRYLISYVHFNRRNRVFRDNLEYFVHNGLIDEPSYHFNFIVNSNEPGVDLPVCDNVTVLRGRADNYDFGA